MRCYGFALRYTSPAVDAISCSVPLARVTPAHEAEIVRAMAAARTVLERTAPRAGDGLL